MDNLLKKEQIYKELKRRLQTGEIPPGSKLKSGLELAQEFNVSHMTIRVVLRELSLEGLLRVVHGKGTFAPNEPVRKTPKLLVLRLGATLEHPGHYIIPKFISRTNELGGQVIVFCGEANFNFNIGAPFSFLNESRKKQLAQLLQEVGSCPV